MFLKQSTAVVISFGPFLDKTDGVALETGLVSALDHASTGIMLSKNGGTLAVRHATVTASTYNAHGCYKVTLDATDTGTLGALRVIYTDAATCLPVWWDFQVIAANVYDSLIGGGDILDVSLTQVNGASQTATLDTIKTDTAAVKTKTEFLPSVAAGAAGGVFIAGTNAATSVTTALTANVTGNLSGSVGSVTGAVGSVTAGVTLAASAVQAIWDALTSALTTAGSIGKKLADWVIGTSQTGDSFARLGAPVGGSISADVAAVKADTAAVKTKTEFLPSVAAGAAGGLFIAGANAATSVTTALTANITGNLSGSVGSVTGAVGSVTAGVTLAASAVQAIWDALTSALTTAGSIGKKLADWVIGTSQTGDSFARLGAPAGASIAADIATRATPAQVNTECDAALADVNLDHLVGTATGIPAVPAGTFLDQITDDGTQTFDRTTDSLQAIRDRGDSAWGGSGGESRAREGTAQGGASNYITLDAGASAVDNFYKNQRCFIDSGTGAEQCQIISAYNGTSKQAAPTENWVTAPDATSHFRILPLGAIPGATAPDAPTVADAVLDALATQKTTMNRDTGDVTTYKPDLVTPRGTRRITEIDSLTQALIPQ